MMETKFKFKTSACPNTEKEAEKMEVAIGSGTGFSHGENVGKGQGCKQPTAMIPYMLNSRLSQNLKFKLVPINSDIL